MKSHFGDENTDELETICQSEQLSDQGLKILEKYAEEGFEKAMVRLGEICIRDGQFDRGVQLIREANKNDDVRANYKIGTIFMQMRNFYEAERYLKYAADKNNMPAIFALFDILYNKLNKQKDAMEYLQIVVDTDNQDAKYEYALQFLYGQYIQQDINTAIKILDDLSVQGYIAATRKLRYIYATGFKVPTDFDMANQYRNIEHNTLTKE